MAQITPLSTVETERAQQMLSWLLQWSPWFQFIERRSGFEIAATDFDLYPDTTNASVQKRGVGSGYTKQSQTPPSRETETLGFHGDRVSVDRSHLADDRMGLRPIGSWVPQRLRKRFRDWVRGIEKLEFQGSGVDDGSGREVKGILTLLDGNTNVPGLGRTLVIDATDFVSASPDSLDMSNSDHRDALRDALEQILPNYDDPGIACNRQLASVLSGIAQNAVRYDREPTDLWGMIERVFGYELIRLIDGVITNTEPDNAGTPNNNTTSMVIAAPAEGEFSVATNSGLYVKDEIDDVPTGDDDDAERVVEWEMRFENAVQTEYSLVRIRNIKVPQGSETYGWFGA